MALAGRPNVVIRDIAKRRQEGKKTEKADVTAEPEIGVMPFED